MLKKFSGRLATSLISFLLILIFTASKPPADYTRIADGIIITIKEQRKNSPRLVKLQVVSDRIIHVTASPVDSFIIEQSLVIEEKKRTPVKWEVSESSGAVVLSTGLIHARVILSTGEISFTDKNGKPVLTESTGGGKFFRGNIIDGGQSYELSQSFKSTPDEAFYGLGQHQNGIMNYRNTQVDLEHYNSVVAVPFLVSSKNYGILWDNYSITKVIDSRDYDLLSTMKLFSADGSQGWLTATYYSKTKPGEITTTRAESEIAYDDIPALKNLPEGIQLKDVTVKWEGSVASDFTGMHTFLLKSAGYAKLWIDGKLVAERWRQAWNAGTSLVKVFFTKGQKQSFKIEWNPDGGESYISCKWLSPLQGDSKNEYGFRSEAGNNVDYYFVYGNNIDEVVGGYRDLTGKATMLPKWAFGFWQSRERYKTQQEIISTVDEFRKRKIPLDNIVEDWSYWEQDKWGSQDFDKSRFPDAEGMIKTLHEKYHTQFMISVWPKFYEGTETFKQFNDSGWMYKRNTANQQRDWIGKGYTSSFYDALNPAARKGFWNLVNKKLYSKGVDAWWLDATEPDIHSNLPVEKRKQIMGPNALGSSTKYFNAFPLQNAKGVYEGQRTTNPSKRVFILTRSAYAGSQRYAATTWSGDIGARWEDFKNQIPAGLNFSLSGIPYWTTDIGGFSVEKRYENATGKILEEWREQMTRWYQFGAFCPLFRVHGQYPFREIYNTAPDDHDAYKSMLYYDKLRYRLMPYIYSLAGETYHHDYTIMRALVMDFSEDTLVKNIGDQYMFGPAILVNPVTGFLARNRKIYLPAHTGWYNLYDGKFTDGGQTIVADAPLQRIPLFIKAGSIIPFGPEMEYTSEKPADPITLFVYAGSDGNFNLYEDENTNYNYESGKYSTIQFNYNEIAKTLTIGERAGNFNGMVLKRTFNIVLITKADPQSFDLQNLKPFKIVKYTGKKITLNLKK
ncbi:MAG: TIM-barrel domain-containing protein [Ferruginibacter sp.]